MNLLSLCPPEPISTRLRRFSFHGLTTLLGLAVSLSLPATSEAAAPIANYDWKPVRIGAGGFVTGMSVHPLDANIRYARTDVGNGYRWDTSTLTWVPIIVRDVKTANGADISTGLSASIAAVPATPGVESMAVDPSNKDTVYIAFPLKRSNDISETYPSSGGALYKSTDRGITFAKTGLDVPMNPNGATRNYGERIAVDPANGAIIYYGSVSSGLKRSIDGGATWTTIASGGPAATDNVININFDRSAASGTLVVNGQTRSAVLYATAIGGEVYRSNDGGQTWSAISTAIDLSGCAGFSTIDRDGRLYVIRRPFTTTTSDTGVVKKNYYSTNQFWRYAAGVWTKLTVKNATGGTFGGYGNLFSLAVDPNNPSRLFSISEGGSLCGSLDGGATWRQLSDCYSYANTLAWLPQVVNDRWRSNGGILMDRDGRLWSPQGNEGVLATVPSATNTETYANPPRWTIQSKGIEELVAHEIIIPPGSGDKAVVSVEDATAFFIDDPDQFTAAQATLQDQLISNGVGLDYCPNAPSYVVVSSSDVNWTKSHRNYSGYSTNGGRTWTPFASQPVDLQCGTIAVSRRGSWTQGADHIVIYPATNRPPSYSHDGGATWTLSTGLPVKTDGTLTEGGLWSFSLRQHLLVADPFVPDKFYLGLLSNGFYLSIDGGKTWSPGGGTGLPQYGRYHSQLVANRTVQNDLWFADGWEGAQGGSHGLYRSTNGGTSFARIPNVDYAITLALGKGIGSSGNQAFSVYVYGKISGDDAWGVFRSTDAGANWTRVAYNPAGLFDRPSSMAASWDTFGLIYVGFAGNSIVYGRPGVTQTAAPVISPRAGTYPGPLAVSITTTTPSATLLYSTNGTDPVNGSIYTAPFDLTQNSTVKSFAYRTDQTESATVSAAYKIIPPAPAVAVGTITRELWYNQTGTTLASVPFDTLAPSTTDTQTSLEAPLNIAYSNFGQRLRGYLIPTVSGNYTFWLASDDSGSLSLSTDDQPSHATVIASVSYWTGYRQWTAYASQRSAPVTLVAGKRYYIEARGKNNAWNNNLSVAWRPDTVTPTAADIVPGSVLSPWGSAPRSTAVFHFETTATGDTQTWSAGNAFATALATSTDQAYAGARSLKVTVNKTSSVLEGASVRVSDPQGAAGKTVTFRVWIPAITGSLELFAFTQYGGNWSWQSNALAGSPSRGAWNTLTLAVPATDNVQTLGVWLKTAEPFTGVFYVDEVAY